MSVRETGKTAFAFPGAGVNPSGREAEFFERHESVFKPLFDEASSHAGTDLACELVEDRIEHLDDERNQYFTYAFGVGALQVFAGNGMTFDYTAGYSFGVYAALHASGALSFSDGLAMVREAYALMREACRHVEAGMGVTVGLDEEELLGILDGGRFSSLRLVNSNSDLCKVLAGERAELDEALREARRRGAVHAEPLKVAVPYHHSAYLSFATPAFAEFLAGLDWRDPACPVISSIDRSPLETAAELVDFAARNLSTPINWQKVVETLGSFGVTRIVECGPGISLSQNGRFIPGGIQYVNVKNAERRLGI